MQLLPIWCEQQVLTCLGNQVQLQVNGFLMGNNAGESLEVLRSHTEGCDTHALVLPGT